MAWASGPRYSGAEARRVYWTRELYDCKIILSLCAQHLSRANTSSWLAWRMLTADCYICFFPSVISILPWSWFFQGDSFSSHESRKISCELQITNLWPWNSYNASHLTMAEKLIKEEKCFYPTQPRSLQKVLLFSLSISADPIRESDFSQVLMMSYGAIETASSWKWMDHKWLENECAMINWISVSYFNLSSLTYLSLPHYLGCQLQ